MDKNRAVIVTGIGVFTSVGCNRVDFWNSLITGTSGIRRIQAFDPQGHKSQIGSEVISYKPEDYFDRKESRKMARVSQQASSAAIEVAATVLAVHHGILPPTINYELKDPECDLDVIPNRARVVKTGAAISNSFGFGGQNGVLVFTKA